MSHLPPLKTPSSKWSLLAMSGASTVLLPIPEGEDAILGSGEAASLSLKDPTLASQHLRVRAREDELEIEDLRTAQGTRLNDVQLSGKGSARAGDVLSVGETSFLVLREDEAGAPRRPVAHEEFEGRLSEQLEAAAPNTLELLLLRLPKQEGARMAAVSESLSRQVEGAKLLWGAFAPGILEVSVRAREPGALEKARAALGKDREVGSAGFPAQGATALQLLEAALDPLLASAASSDPDPLFVDPVMLHLSALLDRLAKEERPVLIEGEAGVGKAVFARLLHHRGPRAQAPFVRVRCETLSRRQVAEAIQRAPAGGTLYLSGLEETGGLEAKGDARLVFSVRHPVEPPYPSHHLRVPRLRDRLTEILPLSEHFLLRGRKLRGAEPLTLTPEARAVLTQHDWPGNVRELRVALERASLLARGEEIRPIHLPTRVLEAVAERSDPLRGSGNLRFSMQAAEKDALLKVLADTSWNVTETAKRLGLPRRTVVYRMGRLQLRRPRK